MNNGRGPMGGTSAAAGGPRRHMRGQEPPRRRHFRGQYVRRRNPSGESAGGGMMPRPNSDYNRTGSFSDDRNDSSPPPSQHRSQQMVHHHPDNESINNGNENQVNNFPPQHHHQQQQQQQPQHHQPYSSRPTRIHPTRVIRHNNYSRNNRQQQQQQQQQLQPQLQPQTQFYDNYPQSTSYQHRQRASNYEQNSDNENSNYDDNNPQNHRDQRHHGDRSLTGPSGNKFEELTKAIQAQKTDIDEIRQLFSKLNTELEKVKSRVKELESSKPQTTRTDPVPSQLPVSVVPRETSDWNVENEREKIKRAKLLRQRERKAAKLAEKRAANSESVPQQRQQPTQPEQANQSDNQQQQNQQQESVCDNQDNEINENSQQPQAARTKGTSKYDRRNNRERNVDKRRLRRDTKEKPSAANKPLTQKINRSQMNDDSTTQAADPSSEDRPEGEDDREGGAKGRVKVFRRKKQLVKNRGPYGNRRRRADSSERNSNDTSPQNEVNGTDEYRKESGSKKIFPELSESELDEIVQTMTRQFTSQDRSIKTIKDTMNAKGPKVVYAFVSSILEHAICDVTSPPKLNEIATNLFQLIVSEDNMREVDFQEGFYEALGSISKREDDIAIDAPRYLDTLGRILSDCVIPMYSKHRHLIKKFMNKSLNSYGQRNRAILLASIMKATACAKDDRFAKNIWDIACLKWSDYLEPETKLDEFLETHEVKFTTKVFSPEPSRLRKDSKTLEKLADDVTCLVESKCTSKELTDLIDESSLDPSEKPEFLGTFVYGIVRGCIFQDSGEYKLNREALNQFSDILKKKHDCQNAVALYALLALTKLWSEYNNAQDLMINILVALHSHGTASLDALKTWLTSESYNNVPSIGAARLNCKRWIDDLDSKGEAASNTTRKEADQQKDQIAA